MNSGLSVLDVSPVSSGSSGTQTLRNTLELARLADRLGYQRYWLAEHQPDEYYVLVSCSILSHLPPLVIHQPGDDAESPSQLLQFLRTELPSETVFELLTSLPRTLDQEPSFLGRVQPHHPVVLRITLPSQQPLFLQPLGKARDA